MPSALTNSGYVRFCYLATMDAKLFPSSEAITNGIEIVVSTAYLAQQSSPDDYQWVFRYRIFMENGSNDTVQLLSRHWFILDPTRPDIEEVMGEGVVGRKPVLEPGQHYAYVSGCQLQNDMGRMWGFYTFQRMKDGAKFDVVIPAFDLVAPYKLN